MPKWSFRREIKIPLSKRDGQCGETLSFLFARTRPPRSRSIARRDLDCTYRDEIDCHAGPEWNISGRGGLATEMVFAKKPEYHFRDGMVCAARRLPRQTRRRQDGPTKTFKKFEQNQTPGWWNITTFGRAASRAAARAADRLI
jgi:hypothetical protein